MSNSLILANGRKKYNSYLSERAARLNAVSPVPNGRHSRIHPLKNHFETLTFRRLIYRIQGLESLRKRVCSSRLLVPPIFGVGRMDEWLCGAIQWYVK